MDELPRYIRHVGEVLASALADTHENVTYLDRGGMSVLFTADHKKLRQRHAIKVFTHDSTDVDDAFRRFEREAVQIAKLNHPHIRRIHDARDLPDARLSFMVMDFVDGDSLSVRLKRESISVADGIAIASQVTGALGAAHDQGIIHRDIKPGNVLLDRDGKAYLADFGIARDSADPALTQANAVPGTERFMAPELFDGVPATARSDLYALGCLLYRMWLGEDPYARIGLRLKAEIDAGVVHEPVAPRSRRSDLPPRVAELMVGLVAIDPNRRPGGCREVLRVLEGARESELSDPTLMDATERTLWRASSGGDVPTGGASGGPAVGDRTDPRTTDTPAPAGSHEAPVDTRTERAPADRTRARPRWIAWTAAAAGVLACVIAFWVWRTSTGETPRGPGPGSAVSLQVVSELELPPEGPASLRVRVSGGEGRELALTAFPEGGVACGTPADGSGVQNSDGSIVQVIDAGAPRPATVEVAVSAADGAAGPNVGSVLVELRDDGRLVGSERVSVRAVAPAGPAVVGVTIAREGGRGGERVGEPARVRVSVTNDGAARTGEVDVHLFVESVRADVDDAAHTLDPIEPGDTAEVVATVTPRDGGRLSIGARVGDGTEVAEVIRTTSWQVAARPTPPAGPRTVRVRCRVEGLATTDDGRQPVVFANGREVGRAPLVFEFEARDGDTIEVTATRAGYTYERQGDLITVRPETDEYRVVFTAKPAWNLSGGRDGG